MGIRVHAPILTLVLAFAPGCVLFGRPSGVVISSDPPGASVSVDRRDTGFVTPCVLAIDADEDKRIDVALPGFQPETRYLTPDKEVYAILWREMSVGYNAYDFPLFLNFRDFFVPVKYRETAAPGRIHVRLDRSSDAANAAAGIARDRSGR